MILPEEPIMQDVPKIIQPRDHKAKVCVWADLTVDDIDRINESLNADHIKMVLSDVFHLDDHKSNLKTGIVMDLFYYTLQFARENGFTKEQTSAFFSIVKKTHEVCIETPFGNVDQTFNYFKELVLCHAVNRPPHSIELFTPDQVRLVTEYTVNSYFRHFKMYKYAFTPLVRLDLSISYVGIPETPPPSEDSVETKSAYDAALSTVSGESGSIPNKVRKRAKIRNQYNQAPHLTQDTNGKVTTSQLDITNESQEVSPFPADVEQPLTPADEQADQTLEEEKETEKEAEDEEQPKTPEPEESPARKELRGMIQTFLSEEIKKMKLSVDDQLKTTEELLNKKLDIAEGGAGKKGGKGSAKASKKK